ncbi:MAG: hypothetical protein A3E78_11665 [Alphaproteobacteria bacterium RIFCSPHIGHO2_12_FULL_63_12]|nr:MAG: hypothetical protein A3E78_11665 [Alphaproteobacteria bacterium RIFCSPHIGHO2_12_FULL_63_12]
MRALVLGSAECLFTDIEVARELFEPDLIVACNDAGVAWPERLDHWATLHPEKFLDWIERRRVAGRSAAGCLWTYGNGRAPAGLSVSRVAEKDGSSGLLCIRVAGLVGGTKIVLCGMPLSAAAHIDGISRDESQRWPFERNLRTYRPVWEANRTGILRNVRSMSGWTADLLGRPDGQWIS